MSDWPQKFLHAFKELHHYESISAELEGLSLDDAYDVQHTYVRLRNEQITGFKAALTAPAAQQAMGVDLPIIGVLFADGAVDPAEPIKLKKQCLLETELGFTLGRDVTAPVSPDDVLEVIASCTPMIEIASPNLATKPNGLDLIATNSASFAYLTGSSGPVDANTIDQIPTALLRDGETILSGTSDEVLHGQRNALAFLINETLKRGYALQSGHLLMSGSIGGMVPAQPGAYQATFGTLGTIEFAIAV